VNRRGYICVFLKPPMPGRVKTRLIPELGAEVASRLAEAMFQDTWAQVRNLSWAKPVLALAGPKSANGLVGADIEVWPQGGGDLGERLERIFLKGLHNAPFTIALGADSPGLPAHLLDYTRAALTSADAVIGPCEDGGFYLLGLRNFIPGLLDGIPWSRPNTFSTTVRRLLEAGLKVRILDPWFDIDRPMDLDKLRNLLTEGRILAPETNRILSQFVGPMTGRQSKSALFGDSPQISVVIPVLNEIAELPVTLVRLHELGVAREIIAVDGGSSDGTREWLSAQSSVRMIDSGRGRGPQLNAGAKASRGEILLFLHADCWLPADAAARIKQALNSPGTVGGAFRVRFVEERPHFLQAVAGGINLRTGLCRCATGDQAIFVRREAYERLGGFAEWPLFEDVEFVSRLKKLGRFAILPSPVTISARRYLRFGISKTIATYYILRLGYWLGISPFALEKWFRDLKPRPALHNGGNGSKDSLKSDSLDLRKSSG
jgi:uncharacterized protein